MFNSGKPQKHGGGKYKTDSQTNLSKTLLPCPYRCVDNLQEKLSSSGVEDENGSIDRFRGQVAFEGLKQVLRNKHVF